MRAKTKQRALRRVGLSRLVGRLSFFFGRVSSGMMETRLHLGPYHRLFCCVVGEALVGINALGARAALDKASPRLLNIFGAHVVGNPITLNQSPVLS